MNKQLKTFAKIATAVAATLAFAGQASADTNLIKDGDFEAVGSGMANGSWVNYKSGSQIGAWTVGGNSVDLVKGGNGSITGTSVDLAGSNSGSLSQTFAAQAGYTYTLSWDYFKNGPGETLYASIGEAISSYAPPSAVSSASLSYTAETTGTLTVSFFTVDDGYQGPTVDNVKVVVSAMPVPEPETYALMLAGIGAIGFVVRRRSVR